MPIDQTLWPVRVAGFGNVALSTGAVLWHPKGAQEARLTIIAKATFTLVREGMVTPQQPDPLTLHDTHHANDTRLSLAASSDLSPYRAGAEILLVGHAYAAPGRAVTVAGARLVLAREGTILVQKTIDIHGDRTIDHRGYTSEPTPFQRMPLTYERAAQHPIDNPAGIDTTKGRAPNLVDPRDPQRPASFGPMAAHWPCRARLLRGLDPRITSGTRLELPTEFDWSYYHTAPSDQRTSFLLGNENILLGGMHPALPVLRTRLPEARGRACIYRGAAAGQPIDLFADTLLIDTDRQVCSLVFRSNIAVTLAELSSIFVATAVELQGKSVEFPDRIPTIAVEHDRQTRAEPSVREDDNDDEDGEEQLAGTRTLGVGSGVSGPALPFIGNRRGTATPPALSNVAPPALVITTKPITEPDEEALAGTFMLPQGGASLPKEPALPFIPGTSAVALPPPKAFAPRNPTDDAEELLSGTLPIPEGATQSRRDALPFITPSPPPRPPNAPPPPPEIPVRLGDTIPVFGDNRFVVVTSAWQVRPPRDSLTIVVKATCSIVPSAPAEFLPEPDMPTGDLYKDDDAEKALLYASDIAIFKPKADVTFTGRAYAPGGRAEASEVSVRFGREKNTFARRMAVFGERRWEKTIVTLAPTRPKPFDSLPLGWQHAYGGAQFDDNPLGVGHGASAGTDGVARLPHFEDPERLIKGPTDKPPPMGFGPIPALWKSRWSKLGTYDARWLESRWPYFPEDFDWAHFQAAPKGQQLEHLAGDEPFDIRGMHKEHPRLVGTLPAALPRCFSQRTATAGGQFSEVRLVLDTVHFDIEAMKIELVWRGLLEVDDEEAPEIAAFFVMAEPTLTKSVSLEAAHGAFLHAVRRAEADEENDNTESDESDVEPPSGQTKEPEDGPEKAAEEAAFAAMLAETEQRKSKLQQEMKAAGIAAVERPRPPPDKAKILNSLRSAGATEEQLATMAAAIAADLAAPEVKPDPSLRPLVIAKLEADEPLDGLDLMGADLSGLDFSERSMIAVDLRLAKLTGCLFIGSDLSEALLSGCDLTGACLDGANLTVVDLTEARLDDATLKGANVEGTDFSKTSGARARLDGAHGEGALFAGGSWEQARFDGAILPKADFTAASLSNAIFHGADLSDVTFYDAQGLSVVFEEARMKDARCDGAKFLRASFHKAIAVGSTWENATLDGASFLGANLVSSTFVRASCQSANFSGANLQEANLRRAKLAKANFFKANLMEANLERADLSSADMRRCNLHGAETWKAKRTGADLDFAIVTQTKLGRRA